MRSHQMPGECADQPAACPRPQPRPSISAAHPARVASHIEPPIPADLPPKRPDYPLYDPAFEHDACGIGFVANVSGRRERRILDLALEALTNLAHRGAMDADAETSDGAGVLTQLPYATLQDWLAERGLPRLAERDLAAGMVFLPRDETAARAARDLVRDALERRGARLLGWRIVPVDLSVAGPVARRACPRIEQAILRRPARLRADAFERLLYLARKEAQARCAASELPGVADTYVVSLSCRSIVYKGLLTATGLPQFYADLRDPRYTTALALFHQRYSTNTFPSWRLAQPMRMLAHNGEINTIEGNRAWMAAREPAMFGEGTTTPQDDARWLRSVIERGGSDSASLDNALELLARSGYELPHALTLLAPEAWESRDDLSPRVRAFFQAQAPLVEPWDGPAALVFSDGVTVGAALDRNGLRPLRTTLTSDGLLLVASETGVVALDDAHIVSKGRLGPGQMVALDTAHGALLGDTQLKEALAARKPYAAWARRWQIPVAFPQNDTLDAPGEPPTPEATPEATPDDLLARQALFGYSHEDVELVLKPMASEGGEAVWSMGDDTPLAALSQQPRPLSSAFRQRFAQVTNPPIDPLREQLVMSLTTYLGPRANLLASAEPREPLLRLPSPLLAPQALAATLAAAATHGLRVARLSTAYTPAPLAPESDTGASGDMELAGAPLAAALDALAARACEAVRAGAAILLLSDRETPEGQAPLPSPLALAAVHTALAGAGLRTRVGLIVETGGAWDTHQIALLLGYGANAVCPFLAFVSARAFAGTRGLEALTPAEAARHYQKAVEKGLFKILARMGLSVIESYVGARLFETLGLAREVVERYLGGTPSAFGRLDLATLDRRARACRDEADRLRAAAEAARANDGSGPSALRPRLADRGYVRFRRNAEYHAANPQLVKALQQAANSGDPADYRRYAELVYSRPPVAIRDLLALRADLAPIPLDAVEPASAIVRRFVSTAMSLGALSPEAHLTLTLGANGVGARSNTGEGGEEAAWMTGERDGVSMNSRIKQVASARFGVTTGYLAHAEELEIKMAQGSKPGEGGQLPLSKVTDFIARMRHTEPGIPLISPPPHHDIYSIEDLAQLIFDLKQVNPRASVGVKLVAERGVGTVAVGVAKAHADYILISGHDGGTGASPLSSIKSAGSAWELGLAEAQQALRLNGLRGRVRLRADGGLKTGRDVLIAALLGADEFGFGTAALIAIGCDMARQCHLDTCPTGIATQREDLRKKFTGRPEQIANLLTLIAEEVRALLATLGARSLDEVIGRSDLLASRQPAEATQPDASASDAMYALDVAPLLTVSASAEPLRCMRRERNEAPYAGALTLNEQFLDEVGPLLESNGSVLEHAPIRNRDRAVGARLAGAIARRYGDGGLPHGSVTRYFTGSAGQSFGAFCVPGMRLVLVGDVNDYVGKGMTGGEIVVLPPAQAPFVASEQVIVGNTALYGATGGMLFARGRAGERFAVRNSGALAVVEGVGDHGCEYMTGGAVVCLGPTGRNFGAGMSGGVAYIYDEEAAFPGRLNDEMVRLARLADAVEAQELRSLILSHRAATGSERAAAILAEWTIASGRFWRVLPATLEAVAPLSSLLVSNARVAVVAGG